MGKNIHGKAVYVLAVLGTLSIETQGICGDEQAGVHLDASTLDNRDCGAYCVGIVLRLLEREVPPFDALKRSANTDAFGQASLLDVRNGLSTHGIACVSHEVSDKRPDGVSIFQLIGDNGANDARHFAVVRPASAGNVVVYCPPTWAFEAPWDSLRLRVGPAYIEVKGQPRWRVWQVLIGAGVGALGTIALWAAWTRLRTRTRGVKQGG